MSSNDKQQREMMGALVPVSRPAVAARTSCSNEAEFGFAGQNVENLVSIRARSTFLAQLTCQYETKNAASRRRAETRHAAGQCYAGKAPSAKKRHLVWA